jgi:ligand-binding sensor domain-containing protein
MTNQFLSLKKIFIATLAFIAITIDAKAQNIAQVPGLYNGFVSSFYQDGNQYWVTTDVGVYVSNDGGNNWEVKNNSNGSAYSFIKVNTDYFAGTVNGVIKSSNNGGTWASATTGLGNLLVYDLAFLNNKIYACTQIGVFESANAGTTWTGINTGLVNTYLYSLDTINNELYAGTGNLPYKLNTSTQTWTALNTGLTSVSGFLEVHDFITFNNKIYIATNFGVFSSAINNISWVSENYNLPIVLSVPSALELCVHNSQLYTGTFNKGVYVLNGNSWQAVNNNLAPYNDSTITALESLGGVLFAGSDRLGGIIKFNNNTWQRCNRGNLYHTNVIAMASNNTKFFCACKCRQRICN